MGNTSVIFNTTKPSKGYPIYVEQPAMVNQALVISVQKKKQEILSIIKSRNNS